MDKRTVQIVAIMNVGTMKRYTPREFYNLLDKHGGQMCDVSAILYALGIDTDAPDMKDLDMLKPE